VTGLFPPSVPASGRRRSGTWLTRAATGALVFGVVAFARVLLSVFFRGFKSAQVYKEAVARARSNPEVRRELGEPVRPGWWVSGSLRVSGPSGIARFSTPLHGPEGQAMLHVQAQKIADRWRFEVLEVEVPGRSERIRLLEDGSPGREYLVRA
jgi:Cytochrome oxidase complex assembly protein 1